MKSALCGLLVVACLTGIPHAHAASGVGELTGLIRAVGPEGAGNLEAARAVNQLADGKAASLPAILAAMDGANDLAMNWLRSAAETLADRELHRGKKLPVARLKAFLADARHHPRARRLAFELIARVDASGADQLLAGMTNDPSPELRRAAVAKIIAQGARSLAAGDKPVATSQFQQALGFARDVDQINELAKQLKALGLKVDLSKTMGFVTHWKVIGPFDSTGGKGFGAVYPPEEKFDVAAEYEGKTGKTKWKDFVTTDEYGVVSMNGPVGKLKGAAAYARAEFYSEKPQAVELRLGSENAWKLWLNGKFLFGQDEYHRNKDIDQYRMKAQLNAGWNVILVKVCQNEQTEDWAGDWDFQLRVCDAAGTPVSPFAKPAGVSQ